MAHKSPEERREYSRLYARKYRAEHRAAVNDAARAARARNVESARAACAKWQKEHRLERAEYMRNLRKQRPENFRRADRLRSRKRRYGTDGHEFWEAQRGRCAICEKPLQLYGHASDSACLDHDHASGMVRGFLCKSCNTGIGLFKDNVEVMGAAIRYLTHGGARCPSNQKW